MFLRMSVVMFASTVVGVSDASAQSAADLLEIIIQEGVRAGATPAPRPGTVPRAPAALSRSAEVARVQTLLNHSGFPAGPADGIAGRSTINAIKAFQSSLGNPATGELTADELQALEARAATNSDADKTTNPVDIVEVQTRLAALGYDVGVADGKWGPRSQRALDGFRRDRSVVRLGRPTHEDLVALSAPMGTLDAPVAGASERKPPAGRVDFTSAGPGRLTLTSLPAVDRNAEFRVAWTGEGGYQYMLTVLPAGEAPKKGESGWAVGTQSPVVLRAPRVPGNYDIVWVHVRDGSVALRRPLEVR